MNSLSTYYKYQKEIKTGDHLGFAGSDPVPFLIKRYSYISRNPIKWIYNTLPPGAINHSACAIKLDYLELERRRYTIEALDRGLTPHMLSKRLERYKGEVYWYPLKDEYNELRRKIAIWLIDHIDTKYDYKNLFRLAIASANSNMKLLFCSETCNFAYQDAGIDTGFPIPGIAPTPADIDQKFNIFKDKIRIL